MFETVTPESVGLSSRRLLADFRQLERLGYHFHGLVLTKSGKIFCEAYFAPFNKDSLHRMYSETKSYVGVAMGVLADRGLVDPDAPIISYFPEYDHGQLNERFKAQTVRQMLTMTTAVRPGYWFGDKPDDRLAHYFDSAAPRLPGGWSDYDSEGSFVLGALIERISGQTLLDFMKENFLDAIGFGPAKMLTCPGGHTWGDSSLICTLRDMVRFGIFCQNRGAWEGKQYISRAYMEDALAMHSDPYQDGRPFMRGYGYQIWRPDENTFAFNGMGGQYIYAGMDKDLVFGFNSDNQGSLSGLCGGLLEDCATQWIADATVPLPEDKEGYEALLEWCRTRTLAVSPTQEDTALDKAVSGKTFVCEPNPMGWKWMRFDLEGVIKSVTYENAQGEKTLRFAVGQNVFQPFPQTGYSDRVGNRPGPQEHTYACAVSGGWSAGRMLNIEPQIIDDYCGRLTMCFAFPDDDHCSFVFTKSAEDFLREYAGEGIAAVR